MTHTSTNRKIFVIIIGISLAGALVLLGLLFDWQLTTHAPTKPEEKTSGEISPSRDYTGLDEKAIAEALKKDANLDIVTLQTKPIDEHTFDSEQQAIDAARALLAAGNSSKALEVYRFIEKQYPESPKSAELYDSASIAADQSGDIKLGTSYLKKKRQQIENDKTLTAEARKDALEKIDSKLALRGYTE